MTTYEYTIATDFTASHRCLADLLRSEIQTGLTKDSSISTSNGKCFVSFEEALSAGEKTTLDGIVAVHAGMTYEPEFITNTPIVAGEVAITTQDWMTLGGIVTNASFFCPKEQAYGEILGGMKASGTGAQVRLVEDENESGGGTLVLGGPLDIPNGDWVSSRFGSTGHQPRDGVHCYRLEGRLNGATSASARFISLTLFKLNVILGVTQ